MLNYLRLAWAHACHHRLQTTLLLLCVSLTFYLPLTTHRLVHTFHGRLTARAHFTGATPLVIGAKGSRFDLVLHALNFRRLPGDNLRARELDWLRDTKLANIIPLYSRATVRQRGGRFPIVGTTLDYLEFRKLRHATGRPFALLGECVLGANAAARLRRGPGDAVLSDPGNFIDLSRQPLRLTITGVLAHTGTADDDAVFVDLKTAWIIAGHGHGHDDESANPGVLLNREGNRTVYNAALEQAIEITSKNLHTFHFHGEHGDLPLTAILALPHDERASALLEGKAPSRRLFRRPVPRLGCHALPALAPRRARDYGTDGMQQRCDLLATNVGTTDGAGRQHAACLGRSMGHRRLVGKRPAWIRSLTAPPNPPPATACIRAATSGSASSCAPDPLDPCARAVCSTPLAPPPADGARLESA